MSRPATVALNLLQRCFTILVLAGLGSGAVTADTRSLDTAFGPLEISGQPMRIVTLYEGALDTALAVGAHTVGAVITRGGNHVADYIKPAAGNINIVGTPGETNIEAVLAAQPDLILAAPRTSEHQYRLLSRLAPVVVPDIPMFQADTWKRETRLFARAMGRAAQAEQVIEQVEARIAEVASLVRERIPADQRDATLIRWMPQGPLVMAEGLFSAAILQATGFRLGSKGLIKPGRPHSEPLSLENLSGLDQNWMFLATLNADGDKALAAARKSPAFARLNAVQENRVIAVSGQLWTSASGPLAALAILDDIEAAVLALQP